MRVDVSLLAITRLFPFARAPLVPARNLRKARLMQSANKAGGIERCRMPTVEEAKSRRDRALKIWRREVQLLLDLQASAPPEPQDLQRKAVAKARAHYDEANDQYLNKIAKRPSPKR